jgi:hypothetical protein
VTVGLLTVDEEGELEAKIVALDCGDSGSF